MLDRRQHLGLGAAYLLFTAWLVVAFFRGVGSPDAPGAGMVVTCPLRLLFDLKCPCCGLTRACGLFLHGHIADALYLNPLCLIVMALLIAYPAMLALDLILKRNTIATSLRFFRSLPGVLLIAAAMIAAWLLSHP